MPRLQQAAAVTVCTSSHCLSTSSNTSLGSCESVMGGVALGGVIVGIDLDVMAGIAVGAW
tara:strand:+ start:604 stop:783 length:180 start_codon:yes stop_codon:yes gene_type:complete